MPNPVPPRPDPERWGSGTLCAGIGAAVLMVICCAAPVLLAAGALGAVGAWLPNPWVIGTAVALVGAVTVSVLRRHSRTGPQSEVDDGGDCCPPAPTPLSDPTDRESGRAPKEGPPHR